MKRVAVFSPLPPCGSGIADYMAELLPVLAKERDIDVYVDDYQPDPLHGCDRVRVHNWRLFESALSSEGYDAVIYQMGNDRRYHGYMYPFALRFPGVLVLHELVLHHLVSALTAGIGHWDLYAMAMLDAHGRAGLKAAMRTAMSAESPPFFEYPLSAGVARRSRAVLVHSHFMQNAVHEIAPETPTLITPHHLPPGAVDVSPGHLAQLSVRRELHLRDDAYLIGSFGLVTPAKRIEIVLRTLRRLVQSVPTAHLLIVGEPEPGYSLRASIDELDLKQHVTLTGRTSLTDFQRYLNATDVTIALRYPTAGETSGSVVRMLAAGKPTVTSRIGWFAELPDIVSPKVDVGEFEEIDLFGVLRLLHVRPDLRKQLGENARAYALSHHSIRETVRGYQRAIAQMCGEVRVSDDELAREFFETLVGNAAPAYSNSPEPARFEGQHIPSTGLIREVARALDGAGVPLQPGSAFEQALAEAALSLIRDVRLKAVTT